jgi:tetratricopeptide (TPR) repeat protein
LALNTADGFQRALPRFEAAAAAPSLRLESYLGLARAYAGLSNHQRASDCYAAAAEAAGNDAARAAQAHEGRAMALLAMNSGDARVLNTAISELQAANRAPNDTAERYFALGRAYTTAGQTANAVQAYRDGLAKGTANNTAKAAAGSALARLMLDGGQQTEALSVLQDALRNDPTSLQANAMAGRLYMDAGRTGDAQTAFSMVISPNATTGTASQQDIALARADAYYYLSVITTQGSPSSGQLDQAIDYAQRAGFAPQYRLQECLARIMRGGEAISASNARACDEAGSTADGYLIRGMLAVRRSQAFGGLRNPDEVRAWRRYIGEAETAFDDGQDVVAANAPPVQWPGYSGTIVLGAALEYGESYLLPRCRNESPSPRSASVMDAGRLFERYRVNGCGTGT